MLGGLLGLGCLGGLGYLGYLRGLCGLGISLWPHGPWLAGGSWLACALTLGMLLGYLGYALTHHFAHQRAARSGWLAQRKRWHALHHHHVEQPVCFGVTSAFWDRVFGTDKVRLPRTAG